MVLDEGTAAFLMAVAAVAVAALAWKAGMIIKKMIDDKKEKEKGETDVRHDSSE